MAENTQLVPFINMDGIGNRFIVIDRRGQETITFSKAQLSDLCSKDNTVTSGCDQLIVIDDSEHADCFMTIYNADGSESGACGNATRCVAWWVAKEALILEDTPAIVTIKTISDTLRAVVHDADTVSVDMGLAKTEWQDIPLASAHDTLHVPVASGALSDAVCVSMGNPHAVFFVENVDGIDLATDGAALEHDVMFPERANIGAAQIIDGNTIRLRVWERGVGETLACGTGACAAFVSAVRRGLVPSSATVTIMLPGGNLLLKLDDTSGHVIMTGPTRLNDEGEFTL